MANDKINIGEFWNYIDVYECVQSKDSKGAKTETWNLKAHVHARVEPMMTEVDTYDNLAERESLMLTVYRIKEMTTRWRVKWNDKFYDIKSITPVSKISPFVHLTAEEIIQ